MKHTFEFWDCENKVPTNLMLSVDSKDYYVSYSRIHGEFGYEIQVGSWKKPEPDEALATEIVKEMVDIMVDQSYDHGSHWVTESIEKLPEGRYVLPNTFVVAFRVRDAG